MVICWTLKELVDSKKMGLKLVNIVRGNVIKRSTTTGLRPTYEEEQKSLREDQLLQTRNRSQS